MFGSTALQDTYYITLTGSVASQYADYGVGNRDFFTTQDGCALNGVDPTSDILNALNEIMFRTSLIA
jgi:hypothetical protein